MKPLLIAATLSVAASPALAEGNCVGRVLLPPVETSHGERVLEARGHVERFYVAPRVERIGHRALVRPGHEERVRLPALYRTWHGIEQVPGRPRYEHEPDRYEMVSERVLVAPGHYVWRRQYGQVGSGPPQPGQTEVTPTGEIMCRVWCPARYEIVQRQVLAQRGRTLVIPTSMERPVTRTVLVRPAGVEVRRTPAEYRWTYTSRVVTPGHWAVNRIPARFAWRERREVHDGGAGWAPVVCSGPLSRPAMARMQASLNAQGYDAGPADGMGRPQTYAALRRFQVDHRMAAGQVTTESARALGVVP